MNSLQIKNMAQTTWESHRRNYPYHTTKEKATLLFLILEMGEHLDSRQDHEQFVQHIIESILRERCLSRVGLMTLGHRWVRRSTQAKAKRNDRGSQTNYDVYRQSMGTTAEQGPQWPLLKNDENSL
jgi:hypothetical protein